MADAMVAAAAGSVAEGDDRGAGPREAGAQGPGRAGGCHQLRQLRVGGGAVGLVEPVDGGRGQQVEAALAERRHGQRGCADVVHGVPEGHPRRQRGAHGGRREVAVGDEERGQQAGRRVEADGRGCPIRDGRHAEATVERGGGIVGVALVTGRQLQDALAAQGARREGHPRPRSAGDRRRGRGAQAARDRDVVVHADTPAQRLASRPASARPVQQRHDEAIAAPRGQLSGALADDLDVARPVAAGRQDLDRR